MSTSEDGAVVFVAAVEGTQIGGNDNSEEDFVARFMRSVRRVRITRGDLCSTASMSMDDGEYTCQHLHHAFDVVLRKMMQAAAETEGAISCFMEILSFDVEVYDMKANSFRGLLEEDILSKSALQTFGSTRLRSAIVAVLPPSSATAKQKTCSLDRVAICGRAFSFRPEEGIVIRRQMGAAQEGIKIHIQERVNDQSGGTGWNVWDGAFLLTRYLESHPQLVQSKRVLELGSGCGLVGIAAAILGACHVVMTDLPHVLPLLQRNIERNRPFFSHDGVQLDCTACDWFHPPSLAQLGFGRWETDTNEKSRVEVILVADCFWIDTLVSPLLQTIAAYNSESEPTVLIAYQRRGKNTHEALWEGLRSIFLSVVEVNLAEEASLWNRSDALFIFRCCGRRQR